MKITIDNINNLIPFKEFLDKKTEYKFFKENNKIYILTKNQLNTSFSNEEDLLNSNFILDKLESEININEKLKLNNDFLVPLTEIKLEENFDLYSLWVYSNDFISYGDLLKSEKFLSLNFNDKNKLFKKFFNSLLNVLGKLNLINIIHLNLNLDSILVSKDIFEKDDVKIKILNFGQSRLINNYESQIKRETYTVYSRVIDKNIFFKAPEKYFNLWNYTRLKRDEVFKNFIKNFDFNKSKNSLKLLLETLDYGKKIESIYLVNDDFLQKFNDKSLNSKIQKIPEIVNKGEFIFDYNQLFFSLNEGVEITNLENYYGDKLIKINENSFILHLDINKDSEINLFKVLMMFNELLNNSHLFNNNKNSLYSIGFLMLYFWIGDNFSKTNVLKNSPDNSMYNLIQEKIYPQLFFENNGTIFDDNTFKNIPNEYVNIIKKLLQVFPEKRVKNFNFQV